MRWVVYGAGAVGGVVGARLVESGERVVFIARGPHRDAMRSAGLRVDSPDGSVVLEVDVASDPTGIGIQPDDVVLLAVKSHQTAAALDALRAAGVQRTPIVCLQNGVDNERQASRLFPNVYGACVMCATGHLEPGVVKAYSAPTTGILDVGRYPHGVDETAEMVATAFERATFSSQAQAEIMRWKYTKLLTNLGNVAAALCGPTARRGPLADLLRAEGETCLAAAGIDRATPEEDEARRGDHLVIRMIGEEPRGGGSSWQSLHRQAGSIETDYLNGEIVLLGRLHGVPTPANATVTLLANEVAAQGRRPGEITEEEILDLVARAG